jgi:hypothetical protein
MPKEFLKSRFRVGSSKSDRLNYGLGQKVFHLSDVAEDILKTKREVDRSIQPDWLEVRPRDWNASTSLATELRNRSKLKIRYARAGILDQPTSHPHKAYVNLQAKLMARESKKEVERGWNGTVWVDRAGVRAGSCAIMTQPPKGDVVATVASPVLVDYLTPQEQVQEFNDLVRAKKTQYRDLRHKIKDKLQSEFPNASKARLVAMATRLLDEKLLNDERNRRFPLPHENFRPNLALTTVDRRYKLHHHPGLFTEGKWSCCLQETEKVTGCDCRVVDPDRWCLDGFK